MTTWMELLEWSDPRSIAEITQGYGSRSVIPDTYGYYVFVYGKAPPHPGNCLYLGRALKRTLRQRMRSYLASKKNIREARAENYRHEGRRRLVFARLKGVKPSDTGGIDVNDHMIHVCWAKGPIDPEASYEAAKNFEHSLIYYYCPLYNGADFDKEPEVELVDSIH